MKEVKGGFEGVDRATPLSITFFCFFFAFALLL